MVKNCQLCLGPCFVGCLRREGSTFTSQHPRGEQLSNTDSYWSAHRLEGDLVEYNFKIIDVRVNFLIAVTECLIKAVHGRKGLFELMLQRIIVHDGGD